MLERNFLAGSGKFIPWTDRKTIITDIDTIIDSCPKLFGYGPMMFGCKACGYRCGHQFDTGLRTHLSCKNPDMFRNRPNGWVRCHRASTRLPLKRYPKITGCLSPVIRSWCAFPPIQVQPSPPTAIPLAAHYERILSHPNHTFPPSSARAVSNVFSTRRNNPLRVRTPK